MENRSMLRLTLREIDMFSFWSCLLILLLRSNLSFAQNDQTSVDNQAFPVDERFKSINVDVEKENPNVLNSERTTINIYPKVSTDNLQEKTKEESSTICGEYDTLEAKELCQNLQSSDIDTQESSSMPDSNAARRFRQPSQGQSYPAFINNGNSVNIQGHFQGSPPLEQLNHQSQPSTFSHHQTNLTGANTFPFPQSPLVALNLHSTPHFNSVAPNNYNPQNQVYTSEAAHRINSKLLVNTSDIPFLLQVLEQQMPTRNTPNQRPNNENIKNGEQQPPHTPQTTPTSIATTKTHNFQSTFHNTPLTQSQNPLTTTFSIVPTKMPYFQSVVQGSPLTQSQSLALLKSQTSLQHNKKDAAQYTHTVPNTTSQNTINIKVPSGSSVSNHQHQADMADILTNLQILTVLMNQDDKSKLIFNRVQNTPVNSPNSSGNNEKVISGHLPDDSQLRHFSKTQETYPSNPQQIQARAKNQIINSLPSYANQFAYMPNPQRGPDKNNSHTPPSQATTQANTVNKKPNKSTQGNDGNNIPRINYPSLSSILQGTDDSNYYNRLVSQLSLSQILSSVPNNPTTGQTTTPLPTPQLTAQQLQQLDMYNKFLNTFNNRHQFQDQQNTVKPLSQNNSNLPNHQDFLLASIIQSQALKKPTVAPPGINANNPYVPAIHGSGLGGLQSIIAQPPAPPPPPSAAVSHLQSFPDTSVPFPVRDAGGGGSSSYSNIQDCLKNTACALFLAGVVATGTTAALAIPVLTPFLGAGLFGKRRRREIRYFVLKLEDSIQFVDNYFQYANGTHVTGLTDDVKCIYNSIMNPDAESSKTMLGSLFRYIIQNKDKLLNVSVQEVETRYQKPIPDSFLQSLRSDNATSQLDLLNKTLFQNVSEEIPHNLSNQSEPGYFSSPDIDSIYKDEPSQELNPSLINGMSDTINHQALPMSFSPNQYEPSPGKDTFSTTNSQPIYEQHYRNPDNNQATELHAYQTGFSQNTPNGYPLFKFQPIPPPQLHLQRSSISDYLQYPLEETQKHSSSSSDATLDHYLSSINSLSKLQFSGTQPINPQGVPLDISGSSQLSGIYNAFPHNSNQIQTSLQHPHATYYSGNRLGLAAAPQYQLNHHPQQQHQQEQQLQSIARMVDFYQTLCHALGEPGIPRSSVITFIAQRCLLFAHAGLVK